MANPTAPFGIPANVLTTIGPGQIWVADFGTGAAETGVTSASAALPTGASGFRVVGYTDDGTEYAYALSTDNIVVAEEIEAVGVVPTGVDQQVSFTLAEATASNLQMALNNGSQWVAGTVNTPVAGQEKLVTIVQECPSGARWVFRKCIQGGTTGVQWKKAPDKHQIAAEFHLMKVDSNPSIKIFPSAAGTV